MEAIKSTRTVKKKNNSAQLLMLLVFLSVIPLYGLYFKKSVSEIDPLIDSSFQSAFDAATSLSQIGLFGESNQILWSLFSKVSDNQRKLMTLELIRRNAGKNGSPKELLRSLYLIQSIDPQEKESKYQKELFDTLKAMGKDKDASLYLQAKSGLKKDAVNTGSAQQVIASVGSAEVYRSELDSFIVENPQFQGKTSEALMQLIIRRVLKRRSLGLLQEEAFKRKLDNFVVEMRVAEYLKRELSMQDPTQMELEAYFALKRDEYNHGAGVQLSHLLLHESDNDVLEKLKSNPPQSIDEFSSIARQHSRSLNKVRAGVINDWVGTDELPTEGTFNGLWEYLKDSTAGFNGPFKSRRGLHYFWIKEKRDAQSKSFDEIKDKLTSRYKTERAKEIQDNYFKKLITSEQVQIFHERM